MARILVTGASGFIGRRLVPQLVEFFPKDEITCLVHDKESPHEIAGRAELSACGIGFRQIELLDPRTLTGLSGPYTHVIHLAATTDTYSPDFSANDIGTRNLLAALGRLSPETWFFFPGSSTAYAGRSDLERPITSATPVAPANEYARTKLRAEEFLARKSQDDGFCLTIARLNTVYGPVPRANSLFDVLATHIRNGSVLARLNWPGLSSIIHVDDVCRRIVFLIRNTPKHNRIYLFSSESLTLADMYGMIYGALGKRYRRINLPHAFWVALSIALRSARHLERVLPSGVYTQLWRANLVSGSVLWYTPDDQDLKGGKRDIALAESITGILA